MRRLGFIMFVAGAVLLSACAAQVLELEVGTCFDDPDDIESVLSTDIAVVDCDTPHDNEVYANVTILGEDFPGIAAMPRIAVDKCLAEFDAYIGTPYETSKYDILWLGPTEESWDAGDKVIICAAYDLNAVPITGSIKGIGQ